MVSVKNIVSSLQPLGVNWCRFLDTHSWTFPQQLDGHPCRVYGTGYSCWGAWAQANTACFLASTRTWDDELFCAADPAYRHWENRKETALALIRYGLGYHTTGEFAGAGGDRWGGEKKKEKEAEGLNNWHSPIWLCMLADAVLALEDDAPAEIVERLQHAVAHDADIQATLDLSNFYGHAEEKDDSSSSHPESNAWKAALLTLARGLCPEHPSRGLWAQREIILWASSFAKPGDEQSDEVVDGQKVRDLVQGSHLAPTATVVHHHVLHPCYMVFPLFSRAMAAGYCARFNLTYPQSAARNEAEVFARLLQLLLPGRLIYPAGKDWPRWVYGQCYLLPVLAHRMSADGKDYTSHLSDLVKTLKTDAAPASDGSLVLTRFGTMLHHNAWKAHRYESDAATCLALTCQFLSVMDEPSGREPQTEIELSQRFYEPLAETICEKRPVGIFAVSGRARSPWGPDLGPGQITFAPVENPHMLEWQSNGTLAIHYRNTPHSWPHISKLQAEGNPPAQHATSCFKELTDRGFAARIDINLNDHYVPSFCSTVILTALDPVHDRLYVYQKVTANAYGFVDWIRLHLWRFTQTVHNNFQRKLSFPGSERVIDGGDLRDEEILSPQMTVDDNMTFILPGKVSGDSVCLPWHIWQQPTTESPSLAVRWFELSLSCRRPEDARMQPGETLAESAMIIVPGGQELEYDVDVDEDVVHFNVVSEPGRRLNFTPELKQLT